MTAEAEQELVKVLGDLTREVAALRASRDAELWPKTTAQFAAYVGRDVRTVQGWIDAGQLKANTRVRPALITRGQASAFLEGGK